MICITKHLSLSALRHRLPGRTTTRIVRGSVCSQRGSSEADLDGQNEVPDDECSDLPQELIDYIVGFLHDHNRALKRCSFLSRRWRLAAMKHLFSSISVAGQSKYQKFVKHIQLPRSERFSGCIRQLSLNGRASPWGPPPQRLIIIQDLVTILSRLPNLKVLKLASTNRPHPKNPPETHLKPYPRFNLDLLDLAFTGSPTPTLLLEILELFSEINILRLRYPSDGIHEAEQLDTSLAELVPATLHVTHLDLTAGPAATEFWLKLICRTASTSSLSELHIHSQDGWNRACVGRLLKDCGHNLRALTLDLTGLSEESGEQCRRELFTR